MKLNEAEQICITVEIGMAEHYGISREDYAIALLTLKANEAAQQAEAAKEQP